MTEPLLTLADLAARWSLSRRAARDLVIACKIPYVLLGDVGADLRTPWRRARWRIEDIEAWERSRRYTSPAGGGGAATRVSRPVAGRLGDWRG